jgi:hypothetical protein
MYYRFIRISEVITCGTEFTDFIAQYKEDNRVSVLATRDEE